MVKQNDLEGVRKEAKTSPKLQPMTANETSIYNTIAIRICYAACHQAKIKPFAYSTFYGNALRYYYTTCTHNFVTDLAVVIFPLFLNVVVFPSHINNCTFPNIFMDLPYTPVWRIYFVLEESWLSRFDESCGSCEVKSSWIQSEVYVVIVFNFYRHQASCIKLQKTLWSSFLTITATIDMVKILDE